MTLPDLPANALPNGDEASNELSVLVVPNPDDPNPELPNLEAEAPLEAKGDAAEVELKAELANDEGTESGFFVAKGEAAESALFSAKGEPAEALPKALAVKA